MKSILILGCNGFAGKSLTEFFEGKSADSSCIKNTESYSITALSRTDLNLLDENAVNSFLSERYYDVIIHSAVWNPAYSNMEDKRRGVEMNLRMFLNVARWEKSFGRMLYFGSGAEYDKRYEIINVTEDELERELSLRRTLPATEYGLAKRLIGQLIDNSSKIYNLRIFGLYGKYEDYRTKFISGCCAKAVLGLPLTIRQNVYFDFLYIDDFCKMIERFINLDTPEYHTYNIATGQRIDLLTLAEYVKNISGKNIPIYVCNEGLGNEYTANGERLQNEIGYHNFISHKDAISELLRYFETIRDKIDKEALLYQK